MKWNAGRYAFVCVASLSAVGCSSQNPDSTGESSGTASSDPTLEETAYGHHHGDASADHAAEAQAPTPTSACIGSSIMSSLGKSHMLVGATMADSSATAAPFDFRYMYIAGGLFDSISPCTSCATSCTSNNVTCANSGPGCAWWGCWQWDQDPPGQYARTSSPRSSATARSRCSRTTSSSRRRAACKREPPKRRRPRPTSRSCRATSPTGASSCKPSARTPRSCTSRPDFWGYAELASSNPHAGAAVATANPTDCSAMENSIAGMGRCMVTMARKYAPNAKVGLHASPWSTGVDVGFNTQASLNVAAQAQSTAAFLTACGADISDFVVVEASDRDAGYYQSIGQDKWWDATNRHPARTSPRTSPG